MSDPAAAIATILAIFVAGLALAYIVVPPFVGFLWLFGLIS